MDSIQDLINNGGPSVKETAEPPEEIVENDIPVDTIDHRQAEPVPAVVDEDFNFDGYQVVRREFFAHLNEPAISFNQFKLYANKAAIRAYPDNDFIQVLVNPETRKLVIRPCDENSKDAFQWARINKLGERIVKIVTCRVFFAKIFQLMEWDPDCRFKILGNRIRTGNEELMVFDLNAAEIYRRISADGERLKLARVASYPAEWKDQFGMSVEEHEKSLQINIFEGYATFGIKSRPMRTPKTETEGETKEEPVEIEGKETGI